MFLRRPNKVIQIQCLYSNVSWFLSAFLSTHWQSACSFPHCPPPHCGLQPPAAGEWCRRIRIVSGLHPCGHWSAAHTPAGPWLCAGGCCSPRCCCSPPPCSPPRPRWRWRWRGSAEWEASKEQRGVETSSNNFSGFHLRSLQLVTEDSGLQPRPSPGGKTSEMQQHLDHPACKWHIPNHWRWRGRRTVSS